MRALEIPTVVSTTHNTDIALVRIRSNENKMSDGGRDRVSLGVDVRKSS
jgi:hypothetical protein